MALLFLHGFMGSGQDWAETVEPFPDYRCILVDLPGHGLSAGCPPGLYPMPQAALALLAVLDGPERGNVRARGLFHGRAAGPLPGVDAPGPLPRRGLGIGVARAGVGAGTRGPAGVG